MFSRLLLSASALNAALVLGAPRLVSRDGPSPSLTVDPNTTQHCSWWVDVAAEYACSDLLENNYISLEEFRRWNPSITATCEVIVGNSYCVEANEEPAPSSPSMSAKPSSTVQPSSTQKASSLSTSSIAKSPTLSKTPVKSSSSTKPKTTAPSSTTKKSSSTKTTTKSTSKGVSTPSPAQPTIVPKCDAFYLVKVGDTCNSIAASKGITAAQLIAWNPSVGKECSGLWADAYACISIEGHTPTTAKPTTTTTKAGNGIKTPSPVQTGIWSNCDSFYKVKSGDTCDKIAKANGISSAQIMKWNPAVGKKCESLWADNYICISITGHTPTKTTKPPATTTGNGIKTPTPIQTGMTKKCKKFHLVVAGDTCASIAKKYSVDVNKFVAWNSAVGGTACTGLWAKYYCCVAIF